MNIAIASDHAGFDMKEMLKLEINRLGLKAIDLGTHDSNSVDYPDFADAMAGWLKEKPADKGVLICGSGIGMSMAANRYKHLRAALVSTGEAAKLARKHNDANVLCLGSRTIEEKAAKDCLRQFLATEFEGGRHAARVKKIS